MNTIEIPFSREMAIAAIEGRKVATTRSEPKGEIGDIFSIKNPQIPNNPSYGHFCLIEILDAQLETVRDFYFRLEGFDSPSEFVKTWKALHRGHFVPDKWYYMHVFGRVV